MSQERKYASPIFLSGLLLLSLFPLLNTAGGGGAGANACDGVFRPGIGRCETGSDDIFFSPGTFLFSKTINFPVPFTNVPTSLTLTSTDHTPSEVGKTTTTMMSVQPPATWTNMPAAKTEVYNTLGTAGSERVQLDMRDDRGFTFDVNCQSSSIGTGAVLRLEYSVNGGTTFNDLASTAGQGDVDITIGTSNCDDNFGTPNHDLARSNNGFPIASALASHTDHTILRVVGINGFGIGDAPTFSQFLIERYSQMPGATMNYFCQPSSCTLTKTSFLFQVILPGTLSPSLSGAEIFFVWEAWSYTG